MDFHVYVHFDGLTTMARKLDAITQQLTRIETKETDMAGELESLKAAVAAENTVIDSAVMLLQGLKAALDAAIAAGDPAALQALSDEIGAKTADLAAQVAVNTPAARRG